MKLPCKYDKEVIKNAASKLLGISKIDLDSPENVEKAISLIIDFLDLEDKLQVIDTFGAPISSKTIHDFHGVARFTLASVDNLAKDEFLVAIKKFQKFIDLEQQTATGQGRNKTETEVAILNIENLISDNSADSYKKFIGRTNCKEPEVIAKCDMPIHWFYCHFSDHKYAIEVYNYFIRKGALSKEHYDNYDSDNIYFYLVKKSS